MTDQLQTAPAVPAHDPGTYRRLPGAHPPGRPRGRRAAARRRVGAVHLVVAGVGRPQRAGQQVAAARGHQLVPALGPVPDLDRLGPGRVAHRRRRQPAARPVDGLRRDARRPPQPASSSSRSTEALTDTGTLFVTPSPQATEMSERFCERFRLDMIRFTNSGTESLMYAIRCARAYTERKAIMKIEGGYHGGYDALQVSVKPGARRDRPGRRADPAGARSTSRPAPCTSSPTTTSRSSTGCSPSTAARSPPWSSSRSSRTSSIVVPDEGYLAGVRAAVRRPRRRARSSTRSRPASPPATRAPPSGSASRPTSSPWPSRSVAACRWRRSAASARSWRSSSTAGWPTSAPTTATRSSWRPRRPSTRSAPARRSPRPRRSTCAPCRRSTPIIDEYELPAHTVGLGRQGLRHLVDDPGAQLPRLQGAPTSPSPSCPGCGASTGSILTPPGLDEQWLVSLVHHRRRHGHAGRRLPRAGPGAARLSTTVETPAPHPSRGGVQRVSSRWIDIMSIIGVIHTRDRPDRTPLRPRDPLERSARGLFRRDRRHDARQHAAALAGPAHSRPAPARARGAAGVRVVVVAGQRRRPASRTGAWRRTARARARPGRRCSAARLGRPPRRSARTAGTASTRSTAWRLLPGRFLSMCCQE